MQAEAISNHDARTGETMKRALSLLAAGAVAAAVGLATIDVPEVDLVPPVANTDAMASGVPPSAPAVPAAVPGQGGLDPALQRPDHGSNHQGGR